MHDLLPLLTVGNQEQREPGGGLQQHNNIQCYVWFLLKSGSLIIKQTCRHEWWARYCFTCRVQLWWHFGRLSRVVGSWGRQVVVMARGRAGGVVTVRPCVGVRGGAWLSDPVIVIISLLLPVTAPLLKVTHVCKFWERKIVTLYCSNPEWLRV